MAKTRRRTPGGMQPVRKAYEALGAEGFYREQGSTYRNPHEPVIAACLQQAVSQWHLKLTGVLDLACGSGEATIALQQLGAQCTGNDPYTYEAFEQRTGHTALRFSFREIAAGAFRHETYSLIVCSFAMHLAETSVLPVLCQQLAQHSDTLLILTPHKRPALQASWGWELQDEFLYERVRCRLYQRTFDTSTANQSA
jgi:SAM-dependent methyltransferase